MTRATAGGAASATGSDEQHIGFWIEKINSYLTLRVGAKNVENVKLATTTLLGIFICYMVISLWRFIRYDPLKGRTGGSGGANKKKKDSKKKTGASRDESVTPPPAEGKDDDGARGDVDGNSGNSGLANDIAAQVPLRTRPLNEVKATSTIKGFQRCQMACSPCGRYVVYADQKSERVHIHPSKYLRPRLGKELASKGFFELDDVLGSKHSIGAIGFSEDGNFCVLGECNKDTYYVFTVAESVKSMSLRWSFKLPRGRVVSQAFDSIAVDNVGSNIYGFHLKNAEMEIINRNSGLAGKDKFKVGDATCWAHGGGGDFLIAGGSFIKDIRLGKAAVKVNATGIQLDGHHWIKAQQGNGAKMAAIAVTTKFVPDNTVNVKSLVIAMDEKGRVAIHDITECRVATGNEPQLVGTFSDPDFDATATPASKCQGIAYFISGQAHHERLHLAFWNAMDCTIYRQTTESVGAASRNRSSDRSGEMKFELLQDIHSVFDGEAIRNLCFVEQGKGIMAVASGHSRGARMWDLVDKTE